MPQTNQVTLLKERRFGPLFLTQFFGAFNDNLFRNALILLFAFSAKVTFLNQNTMINFCAALFIIPFFLFSAMAGQLADKYEKSTLIRIIKWVEVFLAILTAIGFYLNNYFLLLVSLFLLGTQATFFGPIKYSILPQHLKDTELVAGNGLVEMGTFIAILLGTMLGGILVDIPNTGFMWVSVAIGLTALFGLLSSYFIPKAKAYAPTLKLDWHPLRQTLKIIKATRTSPIIFYSVIGISWFWLYGSIFLTQIANYTKSTLGGTEQVATLLLVTFSVGIGVGSLLCSYFSHPKLNIRLVPIGALGLTVFALDLSLSHSALPLHSLDAWHFLLYGNNWRIIADGFMMGVSGGFYIVPLYTLIQKLSPVEERSRIIAANNIINAIFMTLSSLVAIFILNLGFSISALFLFLALSNAIVAFTLFKRAPEFVMDPAT